MKHSEFVRQVISITTWDKRLAAISTSHTGGLLSLLQSSPGALLATQSMSPHETLDLLQKDLEKRLSFDWILPNKPAARRMAVVGGRSIGDEKSGMHGSQGFFQAAQSLGIEIVVIDDPGHWLAAEKYAHLRDDFIGIDMSDGDELPQRIVQAISDRGLDGIVTFTDEYVIATAEAAEILGFATEPARAIRQAHQKQEMRKVVNNTNIQAMHLDSVHQLEDPSLDHKFRTLQYPLIIKPCRSVYSKGVKKVVDDSSLRQAARLLEEEGLAEHGILLETYVDGPEFDANFALWDGEVLFLEVTDNFPCRGDATCATPADNFAETVQISNSRLPPEEIEILRSSIHHSLLQLGFRSGVFHVEGRMQNSTMRYQDSGDRGILDLAPSSSGESTSTATRHQPQAFVIEVNVRPPGTGGTWATLNTYGVDLGALQFLRALQDHERFEAMSKPFVSSSCGDGGGAQHWTAHCMVPIHREKIRVPEDFFEKLYQALPEIVPYVSRAELYAQPGTVVSPTGGIGWIGYLLLFSKTSRRHALEMYHHVSEASKKLLDEDCAYDSGYHS
jgi:biotin carboxylase